MESSWYQGITASLRQAEYEFMAVEASQGVWSAPNRWQELRSRVSPRGLDVFPRAAGQHGRGAAWNLTVRTASFGRCGAVEQLPLPRVITDAQRAELNHSGLIEWFENRSEGLEHGWTLPIRPAAKAC